VDRKLAVLIGLTLLVLQDVAAQERPPIVNRIDHVMTLLPDIAAVDRMQALFADTLGLPPWCEPALRRDANRPTWAFYNTGVYVGGAFLEFLTFNVDEAAIPERSAECSGFALESGVPSIAEHLDERGVAHGRNVVMAMEDGSGGVDTLVTNIRLIDLSRSGTTIFFSHNHPELFENPGYRFTRLPPIQTNAEHHAHFWQLLEESGGGTLGAVRASEIVVSAPATQDVRSTVSALMDPLQEVEPGVWELPEGPALRLEPGDDYGVARVTLTVHSLKKAVEALKRFDLLGMEVPGHAVLDQERLWGIQIWLVEEDASSGVADAR
jgi:hypothetical protein